MQELTVDFDLYSIYDRLMDGVKIQVTLAYDLESIAANGYSEENLYCSNVDLGEAESYLEAMPFDTARITREVLAYFANMDNLEEYLTENLSDEEYAIIEPEFADERAMAAGVPGSVAVMNGEEFLNMLSGMANAVKKNERSD